jgi:hypothetical protein
MMGYVVISNRKVERQGLTPLAAVLGGLVAGAVGTVAMDLISYARYRRGGGDTRPLAWEFAAPEDWEKAPAPAKIGRRLVEALTQSELPAERVALTNNVVHWSYGILWGSLYGIVAGSARSPRLLYGLPFGTAVWLAGYAMLPLAKLYQPFWDYDARTLAGDLITHLAYGAATAGTFRLLTTANR